MAGNDGDEVWANYAKGVKPFKRAKTKKAPPPVLSPKLSGSLSSAVRASSPVKIPAGKIKPAQTDFHMPLDRNLERRLRQGAVNIEARLDLHGMFQEEAHKALAAFIVKQIKASRRALLIVTGKGRGGEGILRANLAGWLADLPDAALILALRPAAAEHGGGGAFYVILKRRRD